MLQSATAIGVMRVRSTARDRAALQLAIDRQLQGAELTPRELPPSALLVVRHLADPLPGSLGADPYRLRPPPAWTDAIRDRLDRLLAVSQQASEGRLSPAAEAVLFADGAKLTACLVLDLVRGVAQDHWWWERIRVALPDLVPPGLGVAGLDPSRVLAATARELPAVFACLLSLRAAVEVVSSFDQGRTRQLLAALAAAHGLDPGVVGPPGSPQETRGAERAGVGSTGAPWRTGTGPELLVRVREPAAAPDEPWRPWLPAAVSDCALSPDQRCLLGLALGLHRAPTEVRHSRFRGRAQTWWGYQESIGRLAWWRDELHALARAGRPPRLDSSEDAHAGAASAGDPRAKRVGAGVPTQTKDLEPFAVADEAGPRSETRSPADLENQTATPHARPRGRHFADDGRIPSASEPSCTPGVLAGNPAERTGTTGHRPEIHAAEVGSVENRTGIPTEIPSEDADDAPSTASGETAGGQPALRTQEVDDPGSLAAAWAPAFTGKQLATRLGGLLYLIHALEALGIPAVFEDHWHLATRLGPWGALDLVGRTLLADRFADHADDPLWAVLAALSPSSGLSAAAADSQATGAVGEGHRMPQHGGSEERAGWPPGLTPYRAPAGWQTALAENGLRARWADAGGRLWLWSDNGYLIASVARDEQSPMHQARSELAAWAGETKVELRPDRVDCAPLLPRPSAAVDDDLGYWAAAATPAVARRLLLALDAEHQDPASLGRLLSLSGTLYLSASHVDLVADLDQIWLPVRRAGLDRDPGWLADYGRVVLFHFH